MSRAGSLVAVRRFLIAEASLMWSTGSRVHRLQQLRVPASRAQAQ